MVEYIDWKYWLKKWLNKKIDEKMVWKINEKVLSEKRLKWWIYWLKKLLKILSILTEWYFDCSDNFDCLSVYLQINKKTNSSWLIFDQLWQVGKLKRAWI